MKGGPFAHSANEKGEWHLLEDHLREVARRAKEFGDKFGAGDWTELAGWWHDIGKINPRFQDYLRQCSERPHEPHKGPPHSIVGALWAARHSGEALLLPLAGHHGGLPSLSELKTSRLPRAWTDAEVLETLEHASKGLRVPFKAASALTPKDCFAGELLIRMIFSALVDADFLDTERHLSCERAMYRGSTVTLDACWRAIERSQAALSGMRTDVVNQARHEIYAACLAAAASDPGFFRLTVPTGGGKTRSAMAFALRHALHHGLERIIVAIPYTSIIDQNAEVYSEIFGTEAVLEHHSAAEWFGSGDAEEDAEANVRRRLASENWDAPIVVTTTVQLFESLFANRVSRCRKLHNIARSVVILDEVQTLPEGLLEPILDVLKTLVADFGVSVVFSSATQPAFESSTSLKGIPEEIREIVPGPQAYFAKLRRVNYEMGDGPWGWKELAERVREHPQCLVVLNRKRDALDTLDALGDPDAFHLSTLLYPAHRKRVLAEIKRRLHEGLPCRVISTQVIEAGVDVDFPVVFRALGPLDRIVQAAGRCNREGTKSDGPGNVVIFEPAEGGAPRGAYAAGIGNGRTLLAAMGAAALHDPDLYTRYFQLLYQTVDTDAKDIQNLRRAFDFPEVASRFRLIDDQTTQVVIRNALGESDRRDVSTLLRAVDAGLGNSREALRRLQHFSVGLYQRDVQKALEQGLASQLTSGIHEWSGAYDSVRGLVWAGPDPSDLIG